MHLFDCVTHHAHVSVSVLKLISLLFDVFVDSSIGFLTMSQCSTHVQRDKTRRALLRRTVAFKLVDEQIVTNYHMSTEMSRTQSPGTGKHSLVSRKSSSITSGIENQRSCSDVWRKPISWIDVFHLIIKCSSDVRYAESFRTHPSRPRYPFARGENISRIHPSSGSPSLVGTDPLEKISVHTIQIRRCTQFVVVLDPRT